METKMNIQGFFENLIEQAPLLNSSLIQNILKSLFIIFIFWLLSLLIQVLLNRRVTDLRIRYRWRKTISYLMGFLAVILIGRVWFVGIRSLATFLGLLSAGIAIALKDLIADLAGWIFILSRRPFDVGDRIQIGEFAGDVIDLTPFQISILEIGNWVQADQSTGRIVHIPNAKIFINELANYDKGFKYIWNEIPVTITFESNWQKAKEILTTIANQQEEHISASMERQIKRATRKFMIYYRNLTPVVYTDVLDNGVRLTIRYLCEPRKRRGTAEAIWEDILKEFGKQRDIDFAYPTTRFYDNRTEGKQPIE
ncbi:MAG: mechanosensitive ion channel [Candidatus Cloacimonetes bacterium]|nr:mechanosensitive ion channel [Candidatus Cloacimonadota bacterium]